MLKLVCGFLWLVRLRKHLCEAVLFTCFPSVLWIAVNSHLLYDISVSKSAGGLERWSYQTGLGDSFLEETPVESKATAMFSCKKWNNKGHERRCAFGGGWLLGSLLLNACFPFHINFPSFHFFISRKDDLIRHAIDGFTIKWVILSTLIECVDY